MPDIDIDTDNRNKILQKIDHIKATMIKKDQLEVHPSGIYLQNMENFELCSGKYSVKPYNFIDEYEYFKIDILNNHYYDMFSSNEEIDYYLSLEPKWEKLIDDDIIDKLPHIKNHHDIIKKYEPKSLEDLAIILALIRPSKKYLIGKDMKIIKNKIWLKEENESYYFKKSHAFSYALLVILILNKLTY